MLSQQQIFDKVSTHLLAQNKRSSFIKDSGQEYCRYRQDGLMCAVGCLIPDDKYEPEMENQLVEAPRVLNSLTAIVDVKDDEVIGLLVKLQEIHDNTSPPEWFEHLGSLAGRYSLNTEALFKIGTDNV
jgi:hypothetical protein